MRDYVIDKISKLIFNRIFTKENKIFVQIIWVAVLRSVCFFVFFTRWSFRRKFIFLKLTARVLVRWANLDYNSKLDPWKKKKNYKKQRGLRHSHCRYNFYQRFLGLYAPLFNYFKWIHSFILLSYRKLISD